MENRLYFPLFVDLTDKKVLMVGAGNIARRRVTALLPFGARITVVAPEAEEEILALAREGRLELRLRGFEESDTEGAALVLTATGDAALDKRVVLASRERGIPVNAAGDKSLCDFYFPGIARRDNIVVGVTAGGTDHRAAARVTRELRELLEK